MKKRKFGIWKILALVLCVFTLSGCTAAIRTVQDKCAVMISYEDYDEGETFGHYGENSQSAKIDEYAKEQGYLLPSDAFNQFMESKIAAYVEELKNFTDAKGEKPYAERTEEYLRGIATFAGSDTAMKSDSEIAAIDYSKNVLWLNYDKWIAEARYELGVENCPDRTYEAYYKSSFNSLANAYTTTITPVSGEFNGVYIEGKSWGDAFDYGFIEGLLVYPVSWLVYQFSVLFGMNGWGQVGAILLTTLIVRGILILLTFRQTLAQQKMTMLKPQLDKIQAKYPNAQTNQYEKQRMAQEQMALYKKNKINPLGSLLVMVVQFPIFIAVWGAMQGSAVLMDGTLLGLSLAAQTGSAMLNFSSLNCITAWVIFLLMAAGQFVTMKLPQWLQKKKGDKVEKLAKNPSMDQSQKTMSMVNNFMLIFIIIMGFSLPVAMAIYWFASSLIGIAQTLIMQTLLGKHTNNKKNVKYKTKKQR